MHTSTFLKFALAMPLVVGLPARAVQAQTPPAAKTNKATMTAQATACREVSFSLATTGNPFDYTQNDILITVMGPGGIRTLPAFYDGDTTWRVRASFTISGTYRVQKVTRNGTVVRVPGLTPKTWTITRAQADFARRQVGRDKKDPTRFTQANGTAYYPVGQNVAWDTGTPIPVIFDHMGQAGENWARVWMNHWDHKNLDWPAPNGMLDQLDLTVAKKWDAIVRAAERNGICFQLTLQHHGQYSTRVNPNWGENPWNRALGGFLDKPEDFFTNARAQALTRAKYRYIVARWGYSPSILAWELFNEVQFTDAAQNKNYEDIVRWHRDMAAFLRQQDRFHHLVTTSSDVTIPHLYDAADYIQPHSYPPDVLAATQALHPSEWNKPLFYGEIGPGTPPVSPEQLQATVHGLLWASLMSEASGAAQFWGWEGREDPKVYPIYAAATAWIKRTGIGKEARMHAVTPQVTTRSRGSAQWGAGADWGKGKGNVFPILPSGAVEGTADMPGFLQGKAHADLFTYAEFPATLAAPGTFTVRVGQTAKAGAHLVVTVDGRAVAERDVPAATADQNTAWELTASIPTGRHTIRVENTGADWVRLSGFSLSPYGPSLAVLGKANAMRMALWVYHPGQISDQTGMTEVATITLPAVLGAGIYTVEWTDTRTGKPITQSRFTNTGAGEIRLITPPVATDVVGWITRTSVRAQEDRTRLHKGAKSPSPQ